MRRPKLREMAMVRSALGSVRQMVSPAIEVLHNYLK